MEERISKIGDGGSQILSNNGIIGATSLLFVVLIAPAKVKDLPKMRLESKFAESRVALDRRALR